MVEGIKTSSEFSCELNDIGRYIKCVVDMAKDRYNGELDGEKLLIGALTEVIGFARKYEAGINADSIIAEVLKGIFKGADKYSYFFPKLSCREDRSVNKSGKANTIQNEAPANEIEIISVLFTICNNIGFIKINRFGKNTYDSVSKALDSIDEANIKKIVLDLRDNCGGILKQAVHIAQRFVPEGLIARVESAYSSFKDIEYRSDAKSRNYSVAVLVNRRTVSSAEILAGIIQDTKSGILIGTNTYGKAEVQKEYPILSCEAFVKSRELTGDEIVDASELKAKHGIRPSDDGIAGTAYITVARYVTPQGNTIDSTGLTPDIYVEDSEFIENVKSFGVSKIAGVQEYYPGDECKEILHAKIILQAAGYNAGSTNTKLEDETVDAIIKYQTDMHLHVSGIIDFRTQEALNKLLESLIIIKDEQCVRTVEYLENCERTICLADNCRSVSL